MKNKFVGLLVVGIAVLMLFIIMSFNVAMTSIVNLSCSHGSTCPMWGTIDFHTNISLAITVIVLIIGLYLIFFGKEEKIITKIKTIKEQIDPKNITRENYQKILDMLGNDEKKVFGAIIDSKGSVLQKDLIEGTDLTKVKITRVLDRLEGKDLIERKRRGMSNMVVLKH